MASLVRTPFIRRQYKPEDLHSPALRVPKHEPATRIQYSSAPPDIRTVSESPSEVSSGQTSNELPQGGVPYTAVNNTASPDKTRRAWFAIPFVARKTRKHASKVAHNTEPAPEIHHQVSPDHHTNTNPSPPNSAVITSSAIEAVRPSLASSAHPAEQPIQETQEETVTVPRSSPSIYLLAKRVFVGRLRDIELPSMLEEEWQVNVRDRLINDLRPVVEKILPHVSRHGAIIEPILCMTGEEDPDSANVQLRPTIWIKCGSRRCKNAVRQEVQHLAYLQAFSKGRVQVHLGAPIYASYSHAESGLGNPFMQLPEGFGRLVMLFPDRSSHSSACGIQLKHISNLPGNDETTWVIGGAISVDNMVYGLTTAHSFFTTHCQDFSDSESVIADEDSELDMTADPAITRVSRTAPPATQGRWRTAVLSNFSYAGKTLPNAPEGFPQPSTGSDFALIRLDMSTHALPNIYFTSSSDSSNSLRHQLDGYSFDLIPGDVLIVCSPDDVRPGYLLKDPAVFVDGTSCFRTRKIETNSPLEPGISGSWVVRGSTLLGMIIAIYLQESYALMLPVRDVFSDIEKLLTKHGRKPKVDIFNPASDTHRGDYIDRVWMDQPSPEELEQWAAGYYTYPKDQDKQVDTRIVGKKEETNIDLEKGEQGRVSPTHFDNRTGVASEAPADEAETNPNTNIVDWDGPEDPENPRNWSQCRKWGFLLALSAVTWITLAGSYLLTPAIPQVTRQFEESSTLLAPFVVSVYMLGFALGPLVIAPLSELYGRVWVYNIFNVFFIAFTTACALSPNFRILIGFRFLEGCAGAAPVAIGGRSIVEIFPIHKRTGAMAIWNLGMLLGPITGPIAAGFIVEAKGWRWVFWIFAIVAGFFTLLFLVFNRETYTPILLKRKAARLRKETGNLNLRSRTASDIPLKEIFRATTIRAIQMLSTDQTTFLMSLYLAVNYGILHVLFTTIVFVFQNQYHFSPSSVGLSFIGAGIGMLFGQLLSGMMSAKVARRHSVHPEHQLSTVITLLGGIGLPIGLFLYGWAAHYKLHYITSITGTAFVGFGSTVGIVTVYTYLGDAFPMYAVTAIAAVTVARSVFSALLPLAGLSMYNTLGLGWGNSVLGFISLALVPIPIVFRHYGERIRMNSRFQGSF